MFEHCIHNADVSSFSLLNYTGTPNKNACIDRDKLRHKLSSISSIINFHLNINPVYIHYKLLTL